ncbi:MAG TPA: hypothetical protein VNK04_19280 [Gemmataceae bacterium]|nr:hypothetical protein [Gemmataceae bacterium]
MCYPVGQAETLAQRRYLALAGAERQAVHPIDLVEPTGSGKWETSYADRPRG